MPSELESAYFNYASNNMMGLKENGLNSGIIYNGASMINIAPAPVPPSVSTTPSTISNENSNFTGLNYPPSTTNMQQQLNLYENNNKLNLIVNNNTNGGKKPKKSRKDTSNSFVYFLFLLDISK